jgi:hypothetical protein
VGAENGRRTWQGTQDFRGDDIYSICNTTGGPTTAFVRSIKLYEQTLSYINNTFIFLKKENIF